MYFVLGFFLVLTVLSACKKNEVTSGEQPISQTQNDENDGIDGTESPSTQVRPQAPEFLSLSGREFVEPGETRKIRDFMEVAEGPLDSDSLEIEIFDAHCGRGYFSRNGQILDDRTAILLDARDVDQYSYTSSPEHNVYDEIHFAFVTDGTPSEKRKVNIVSKGEYATGLEGRKKDDWARDGRVCQYLQ